MTEPEHQPMPELPTEEERARAHAELAEIRRQMRTGDKETRPKR